MQVAQLRFAWDMVEDDGDFLSVGPGSSSSSLRVSWPENQPSFFHSGLGIACIQAARVPIVDPHVTLGPFPADDWDAGRV